MLFNSDEMLVKMRTQKLGWRAIIKRKPAKEILSIKNRFDKEMKRTKTKTKTNHMRIDEKFEREREKKKQFSWEER